MYNIILIFFELDSDGGNLLTVVVASLIAMLLVFSVITFIVGFIIMWSMVRKKI